MISEDNKVFVIVNGTAEGMDTLFGHYFEVVDGKVKVMTILMTHLLHLTQ
jgi:hypothetical protein